MTDSPRAAGLTRRGWIAAGAALTTGLSPATNAVAQEASAPPSSPTPTLPVREAFPNIVGVHLNGGAVHPAPAGAITAMENYIHGRGRPDARAVIASFARLINADVRELAYVQSTTLGEDLVVRALGLPEAGGRVVTDALHFYGSFYLYNELQKAGVDVVVLPYREGRILMSDMEAAVNDRTRLVAVSAISTVNGFQHDLKAVADLAHAHGAKVYVDAIHALGTVPIDVKASNIDFLASSTYKWLMGDMGTGFLYARADLLPALKRPQHGYGQLGHFAAHALPGDPPGEPAYETAPSDDAAGLFAGSTTANDGVVRLGYTLPWLLDIGVANIQAWRQPLIEHVRRELTGLGLEPMTPADSTGPLLSFYKTDARTAYAEKLRSAGVQISVSPNRIRVSVSIYNSMQDIDRLVEALA